jgi:hypothetical protein
VKQTLVRYKTKPEQAQENERLIEAVFRELRVRSPDGLRYLALKLTDGTFVHFVMFEKEKDGSALTRSEAFRAFQGGIKERCLELPQAQEAMIVGNYRMIDE